MLLIASGAVPVLLERLTTNGVALTVPTCWFPNVSTTGLNTSAGDIPVPLKGMLSCGLVGSVVVKVRLPARAPIAVVSHQEFGGIDSADSDAADCERRCSSAIGKIDHQWRCAHSANLLVPTS